MNKIINQIQKLCSPAKLYFVISVLSFLGMLIQNCNSTSVYQVGTFKADTPCHPMWFFLQEVGLEACNSRRNLIPSGPCE